MRIRTIKPEFFTHEGLFELEKEMKLPLRVAFAGLWCIADREGRFKWEPRRIGVAILPYDGIDFSRVLDALTTRAFVVKYRVGDALFGVIPSFTKHQVINNREKASELPEPSKQQDSNACHTRAPRVPHAGKEEGKGREGKGNGVSVAKAPEPGPVFGPKTEHTTFKDGWMEYYKTRNDGAVYPFGARDAKAIKQLLQHFGRESKVREFIKDVHAHAKDGYPFENAETLHYLANNIAQLQAALSKNGRTQHCDSMFLS